MMQRNVLGGELMPCSMDPITGYYRTGCCENRGDDPGMHVVCCRLSECSSRSLPKRATTCRRRCRSTGFPACSPVINGACARPRWAEALEAGMACPVVLEATHVSALEFVDLDDLEAHAYRG